MWRRLIAGGPVLVGFRAVAALFSARLITGWALWPFTSLLEILPRNPFHETGDIQLGGVILMMVLLYGGLALIFFSAWVIVYIVLSQLSGPVQAGAGILLVIAALLLRIDRPGHFALRYEMTDLAAQVTRPAPRVPPFSLYISPAKERELRHEGRRRMRAEWIGEQLQLTNLTAESVRLRIDFYGAYSHNSSINCRGDREVPVAKLTVMPAQSTYTVNRVVCGDGFQAYAIWAWNDAGEMVFHESTH
jgi:hypothetical protein